MDRRAVDLGPDLRDVAAARRFVGAALDDWGIENDAVGLVTSEIVSNALEHASSRVTLAIQRDGLCLRLEVSDGSAILPVIRELDPSSVQGRGMGIVQMLASAWGTEFGADGGKTVWVEFQYANGPPREADGPTPPPAG